MAFCLNSTHSNIMKTNRGGSRCSTSFRLDPRSLNGGHIWTVFSNNAPLMRRSSALNAQNTLIKFVAGDGAQ